MSSDNVDRQVRIREFWGLLLLIFSVLITLALVSFHNDDITLFKVPVNDPLVNFVGPGGSWFCFTALMTLGLGAFLLPVWCAVTGILLLFRPKDGAGQQILWGSVILVAVSSLLAIHPSGFDSLCERFNISGLPGGLLGWLVGKKWIAGVLGNKGATVLAVAFLCGGTVLFVGRQRLALIFRNIYGLFQFVKNRIEEINDTRRDQMGKIAREEQQIVRQRAILEKAVRKEQRKLKSKAVPEQQPELPVQSDLLGIPEKESPQPPVSPPVEKDEEKEVTVKAKTKLRKIFRPESTDVSAAASAVEGKPTPYNLPSVSLLQPLPTSNNERVIEGDIQITAGILKGTLADFGIECEITNVVRGPVVTQYQLLPAAGVRVEKISQLSNNLQLNLKASSVRVQAPIPGKGVVGIEVPNATAKKVYLREILEGEEWKSSKAAIPLVLGKDIKGTALVADLSTMPHLLIAGATGSGKTVCMNSILAGILMSKTPEQLRLMLIDPKRVEFSSYIDLPHLVVPVITEAKKVPLALRWAITEMEKRYQLFARVGVRNIQSFNARPVEKGKSPRDTASGQEEEAVPATIPYIVIVVDELSDLMLVAQSDIENAIARLAQMSRAVGIHMILATQRPSVNVITGTIKANFPARLSFKVAQKVDSRTILDTGGADKLLGRGDMLILPPASGKLIRAQGAITTDADINAIAEFIRNQAGPNYEIKIKQQIERSSSIVEDEEGTDDEMLNAAISIIRETRRASVSLLQRRLKIGYNRAGRLMDIIEERGIVGPAHGSDPREILVDLDAEIPGESLEDGEQ